MTNSVISDPVGVLSIRVWRDDRGMICHRILAKLDVLDPGPPEFSTPRRSERSTTPSHPGFVATRHPRAGREHRAREGERRAQRRPERRAPPSHALGASTRSNGISDWYAATKARGIPPKRTLQQPAVLVSLPARAAPAPLVGQHVDEGQLAAFSQGSMATSRIAWSTARRTRRARGAGGPAPPGIGSAAEPGVRAR